MATAAPLRTPIHLWIVAVLALIWNGYGSVDYLMTKTRNIAWISQTPGVDPQAMLAWTDGFPLWANFGWGLGVWMGLVGSVLLVLRHRWAAPAFALSFVGAIIGLGYQIFGSPPPPPLDEGFGKVMPWVIIVVALALYAYARAADRKGILR